MFPKWPQLLFSITTLAFCACLQLLNFAPLNTGSITYQVLFLIFPVDFQRSHCFIFNHPLHMCYESFSYKQDAVPKRFPFITSGITSYFQWFAGFCFWSLWSVHFQSVAGFIVLISKSLDLSKDLYKCFTQLYWIWGGWAPPLVEENDTRIYSLKLRTYFIKCFLLNI